MEILSICVPLVIALFAMAYPLAISEIGSINSKYGSERIINLLRNEKEWKYFNLTLYVALSLIALYISGRVFEFSYRWMHVIIWSIFILSILLSFSLILFVQKILFYKSDLEFKDYLLNRNKEISLLPELSDLYIYFIKKDPVNHDNDLWTFFSKYFRSKRNTLADPNSKEIQFSTADYNLITSFNRLIISYGKSELILLQYNVSAGEWLIGRHEYNGRISENTLRQLWYNVYSTVEADKPYIVFKLWQIIFDYFDHIPIVLPTHDEVNGELVINNQDSVDYSLNERQDLIDFIAVLGGLLYYSSNLKVINQCFYYTQSQPPNYKAFLPGTIKEALGLYCKFYRNESLRYVMLDIKYPFPDLDGVNADNEILGNALRFIILIYLRLFTIYSYYVNYEPLDYMGLNEGEVSALLEFQTFFKTRLTEFVEDEYLVKNVFGYRTFNQNPIEYFDQIVNHYSQPDQLHIP